MSEEVPALSNGEMKRLRKQCQGGTPVRNDAECLYTLLCMRAHLVGMETTGSYTDQGLARLYARECLAFSARTGFWGTPFVKEVVTSIVGGFPKNGLPVRSLLGAVEFGHLVACCPGPCAASELVVGIALRAIVRNTQSEFARLLPTMSFGKNDGNITAAEWIDATEKTKEQLRADTGAPSDTTWIPTAAWFAIVVLGVTALGSFNEVCKYTGRIVSAPPRTMPLPRTTAPPLATAPAQASPPAVAKKLPVEAASRQATPEQPRAIATADRSVIIAGLQAEGLLNAAVAENAADPDIQDAAMASLLRARDAIASQNKKLHAALGLVTEDTATKNRAIIASAKKQKTAPVVVD